MVAGCVPLGFRGARVLVRLFEVVVEQERLADLREAQVPGCERRAILASCLLGRGHQLIRALFAPEE